MLDGFGLQYCLQVDGWVTDASAREHRMVVLTSGNVNI